MYNINEYSRNKITTVSISTQLEKTHDMVFCNSGTAITITLPDASTTQNKTYIVKNINTGTVTIGRTSNQTIDGEATDLILESMETITLTSNGSNWFKVTAAASGTGEVTSSRNARINYMLEENVLIP